MLADEMGWDGEVSGSWTWWVIWWEEGDGGCGACNVIYTVVGKVEDERVWQDMKFLRNNFCSK